VIIGSPNDLASFSNYEINCPMIRMFSPAWFSKSSHTSFFFTLVLCRDVKLSTFISMGILKFIFSRKRNAILGTDGFSDIGATLKRLLRDIIFPYRISYFN